MAIASAAAAEAAVTAAHAAAEVVRLTGVSQSALLCKEKSEESQPLKTSNASPQFTHQCKRAIQESAAVIRIQTAFRGYLVSFSKPFCLICVTLRTLCIIFNYIAKFLTDEFRVIRKKKQNIFRSVLNNLLLKLGKI